MPAAGGYVYAGDGNITNFKLSNGILTWDAYPGVDHYELYCWLGGENPLCVYPDGDVTKVDLNKYLQNKAADGFNNAVMLPCFLLLVFFIRSNQMLFLIIHFF